MINMDPALSLLLMGLFGVLAVASIIGFALSRRYKNATIANLNARIRAWWLMCTVSVIAMLMT